MRKAKVNAVAYETIRDRSVRLAEPRAEPGPLRLPYTGITQAACSLVSALGARISTEPPAFSTAATADLDAP